MADKLHSYGKLVENGIEKYEQLWFLCPGCKCHHGFTVGLGIYADKYWTWNGSLNRPTFHPSLLCNKDFPDSRCHSFVRDGTIQFLEDSWHELKGQTVEIPDWEY